MGNIEYIRQTAGEAEILAQLAEEAAELGHAALKMRRALIGENPTPVQYTEARIYAMEEIADVALCLHLLELTTSKADLEYMDAIIRQKCDRWAYRLKAKAAERAAAEED